MMVLNYSLRYIIYEPGWRPFRLAMGVHSRRHTGGSLRNIYLLHAPELQVTPLP